MGKQISFLYRSGLSPRICDTINGGSFPMPDSDAYQVSVDESLLAQECFPALAEYRFRRTEDANMILIGGDILRKIANIDPGVDLHNLFYDVTKLTSITNAGVVFVGWMKGITVLPAKSLIFPANNREKLSVAHMEAVIKQAIALCDRPDWLAALERVSDGLGVDFHKLYHDPVPFVLSDIHDACEVGDELPG